MDQWEKTRRREGATRFPSTHWSAIFNARTQDETRRRLATDSLVRGYWNPVYCYLRRRYRNEEAEDLTQDFFVKFFVKGKLLCAADREIGRFRQLLLTALKRFALNVQRDKRRKIRAPTGGILSFSSPALEGVELPDASAAPEDAFYYAWITDLLGQVLTEVKEQYCGSGMARHWDVFRLSVLAPILEGAEDLSLREISQRCGVATAGQAGNMLTTVKRRFQRVLKRRLRNLARSEAEAEAEFREIFRFLAGTSCKSATFGLSHEKLARLWGVGDDSSGDPEKPTPDQRQAEALRDELAEALPLDPAVSALLPETLSHVLEQFHPLPGCSVGSLLLDPDTDPAVVWQIKDRYRRKAESGSGESERQAATILYYAALAHALLFQEDSCFGANRITTFSYPELETYFAQLLGIGWLTPELAHLFERAQVVCRKKGKESPP